MFRSALVADTNLDNLRMGKRRRMAGRPRERTGWQSSGPPCLMEGFVFHIGKTLIDPNFFPLPRPMKG